MKHGYSPLWALVGVAVSALVALAVSLAVRDDFLWLVPWLGAAFGVALVGSVAWAAFDQRRRRREAEAEEAASEAHWREFEAMNERNQRELARLHEQPLLPKAQPFDFTAGVRASLEQVQERLADAPRRAMENIAAAHERIANLSPEDREASAAELDRGRAKRKRARRAVTEGPEAPQDPA